MRGRLVALLAVAGLSLMGGAGRADVRTVDCQGFTGIDVRCTAGTLTVLDTVNANVFPSSSLNGFIGRVVVTLASETGEVSRDCVFFLRSSSCSGLITSGHFVAGQVAACKAVAPGPGAGGWQAECRTESV